MNEQQTAHYLANRYPYKVIVLFECEHRGEKEKHHPNYSKPFEVELLCHSCHGEKRAKKDKRSFQCMRDVTEKRTECAFFSLVDLPYCAGCPQKGKNRVPAGSLLRSPGVLGPWLKVPCRSV